VWALGSVLLAATAILSLAAPYVAQRKVDEAVSRHDPGLAAQAHDWNPVSVEPLLTQAVLEEAQRHNLRALQLYHEAVDTQPDNPDAWVELGRFELDAMKDPCSAYRSLNEAYTLDRFNPVISAKNGPLDRARRKVNAGACA
jgi:tetratricopeptide (TPR) repeat protein